MPTWLVAVAVFVCALLPRLVSLRQPLVENFIDRQVHTAMMARNLARGGSLLYPEIDIGPFPAYYMLEFPGYPALATAMSAMTGMHLDVAGRFTSALATALACLVLFDLVRRYDGTAVGVLAALVLAVMPVTVRFGRAFQPDAMMLACLVTSVWAMDRWGEQGRRRWLVVAALAASAALLLKVISAYVLLPLAYLAWARYRFSFLRRWELWAALSVAVLPAAAWYAHAWHVATSSATVSTPFWQAHKWVSLERFFVLGSYRQLAYHVGLRVLTPIGVVLAVGGALLRPGLIAWTWTEREDGRRETEDGRGKTEEERRNRRCQISGETHGEQTEDSGINQGSKPRHSPASSLFRLPSFVSSGTASPPCERPLLFHVWLGSLIAYFPILVRKLDHEHYYLALAPVAAVFIARALAAIATAPLADRCYVSGRLAAVVLGMSLLACDALTSRSTFRVPSEWRHVVGAAASARECTPPDSLVAAHSSVLFYTDRRGFTFAYGLDEIAYLFGTWGEQTDHPTPERLLEFYRRQGAKFFVELLGTGRERNNRRFFEYVRSRYRVVRQESAKYVIFDLKEEAPLQSDHADLQISQRKP